MKLTVQDVAKIFQVSEKTVYRWISSNNLPAYSINDQYRFHRTELIEWAISKKVNFSPALFDEPESSHDQLPSLTASLESGGVFYRLSGNNKSSVLKELVRVVRTPEDIEPDFLCQMLLARENTGTTAIGDGIAIPHARMPLVLHVAEPSVSLCFLETPIEFGALDGILVHTLFTIISPTIRCHLHLLSVLSYVLRDQSTKDLLKKQGSRSEILAHFAQVESTILNRKPV